jgi:hypothetical protein
MVGAEHDQPPRLPIKSEDRAQPADSQPPLVGSAMQSPRIALTRRREALDGLDDAIGLLWREPAQPALG